ncbi:unnamed protein product, partial [Ilex paraguariensis]
MADKKTPKPSSSSKKQGGIGKDKPTVNQILAQAIASVKKEEDPPSPSLALLPKPTYSAYASANAPGHSSALTIANRFTPLGRP